MLMLPHVPEGVTLRQVVLSHFLNLVKAVRRELTQSLSILVEVVGVRHNHRYRALQAAASGESPIRYEVLEEEPDHIAPVLGLYMVV